MNASTNVMDLLLLLHPNMIYNFAKNLSLLYFVRVWRRRPITKKFACDRDKEGVISRGLARTASG
jgi:hypothetical protein